MRRVLFDEEDVEVSIELIAEASPLLASLVTARPPEGFCRGRHFSTYVEEVRSLKRSRSWAEAESLLVELVGATEREDRATRGGVAPWYYEQLAIVYAKRGESAKEISILERFARARHAPGASARRLLDRLERLRAGGDGTCSL